MLKFPAWAPSCLRIQSHGWLYHAALQHQNFLHNYVLFPKEITSILHINKLEESECMDFVFTPELSELLILNELLIQIVNFVEIRWLIPYPTFRQQIKHVDGCRYLAGLPSLSATTVSVPFPLKLCNATRFPPVWISSTSMSSGEPELCPLGASEENSFLTMCPTTASINNVRTSCHALGSHNWRTEAMFFAIHSKNTFW